MRKVETGTQAIALFETINDLFGNIENVTIELSISGMTKEEMSNAALVSKDIAEANSIKNNFKDYYTTYLRNTNLILK